MYKRERMRVKNKEKVTCQGTKKRELIREASTMRRRTMRSKESKHVDVGRANVDENE